MARNREASGFVNSAVNELLSSSAVDLCPIRTCQIIDRSLYLPSMVINCPAVFIRALNEVYLSIGSVVMHKE